MAHLQSIKAVYKQGRFIFETPSIELLEGSEVVVTFIEENIRRSTQNEDIVSLLKGRGKGEHLVEKLLQSRQQDKENEKR